MAGVFSREAGVEGVGVPLSRRAAELGVAMEATLAAGAALTFMASDDGEAWAVSVLFNGRRVGRIWVRTDDDYHWALECLSALDEGALERAWEAAGDGGGAKGSYGLAKVTAAKGRRR